jgi:hypothetical protein
MVFARALTQDRDLAASGLKPDSKGVLDRTQVFVGYSEERGQSGFGQGYGVVLVGNRLSSLRGKTVPRMGPGRVGRAPSM